MPKTKKKFIDKKNAITFHLVHRSQQDPLVADETAPQHVLVPALKECKSKKVDIDKRKEEQRKYGVYFDDDYNYLQHLRDVNKMVVGWEPAPKPSSQREDFPPLKGTKNADNEPAVKIQLPSSVFESAVEEDVGLLNKAAPRSGLCLDLDPDVVAAMDEDFDFDDPNNELEDNFIELATAEGNTIEVDSDVGSDGSYEDMTDDEDDDDDDEVASLNSGQFTFAEEETKSRFTNYSMSSSVMRRNNQLTILDDRFEQMYADYDDNEIGALDCEEIEGHIAADSEILLQCAQEFQNQKEKDRQALKNDKTVTFRMVENTDSESEKEIVEVIDKKEKWDCESIISTYSNLYNHPKLISEPKDPQKIRVSGRTGIPLDVLDGSGNKLTARALSKLDSANNALSAQGRPESIISTLSSLSIRPKDETVEQKRERKKNIKDYRKERRSERKANTEAFKDEKKRQEKIILNNKNNQQGVKIL